MKLPEERKPQDPGDDLLRFLAAIIANVETPADVANVPLEPWWRSLSRLPAR